MPYRGALKDLMTVERFKLHTPPKILDSLADLDPAALQELRLAEARLEELNTSDLLGVCLLRLRSNLVPKPYVPPAPVKPDGRRP